MAPPGPPRSNFIDFDHFGPSHGINININFSIIFGTIFRSIFHQFITTFFDRFLASFFGIVFWSFFNNSRLNLYVNFLSEFVCLGIVADLVFLKFRWLVFWGFFVSSFCLCFGKTNHRNDRRSFFSFLGIVFLEFLFASSSFVFCLCTFSLNHLV
jgi:hypothetical protein